MDRYLFNYRNSIHSSTGVTPSSLIFKNKIRTRLDISFENKIKNLGNKHMEREGLFKVGDGVWIRDYRQPNKKTWAEGVIDEVINERIYLCKVVKEGFIWKRHVDDIIKNVTMEIEQTVESPSPMNLDPKEPLIKEQVSAGSKEKSEINETLIVSENVEKEEKENVLDSDSSQNSV